MAVITIRNLEDEVKRRLKIQAASHSRSMEEEVREIIRAAVRDQDDSQELGTLIHERFVPYGGVELPAPLRDDPPREPDIGR